MLYTTIDPKRHWFFNTSIQNILNNKELSYGNVLNLLKLVYIKKTEILLLDSGIYEKLFILLFGNNRLSVVLHGELGYKYHQSLNYRLYFKIVNLIIRFSKCDIILLSRYVLYNYNCKKYKLLEHPGFAIKNKKLQYNNQLFAIGAISNQKLSHNSLIELNSKLSEFDTFVDHYGNTQEFNTFSNFIFNGYVKDIDLNNKISSSKYLLLINDSKYKNIVSGVVIQAIYNDCIIVTLNSYPEIIDFYENYFKTKIHIDLESFLKILDKNNYYQINKINVEKVKNELYLLSKNDIFNIINK